MNQQFTSILIDAQVFTSVEHTNIRSANIPMYDMIWNRLTIFLAVF